MRINRNFFLIIYSYISHYFYPHAYTHNLILLILGLIFFFYFFKFNFSSNLLITIIVFSIILVGLIIFKTHDDFPYYHFPYTYYLTQNPIVLGIGKLNHGFRTPSSIFYLNSLFYLPFIKYYLFHTAAALILGFTNIILISSIFKKLNNKEYNYLFFLKLLSLAFINIFFYRLQEHGTDRSAQILILLFIIELFDFKEKNSTFEFQITKLFILLGLIISLKSFYLLYLIFAFPTIYYLVIDGKLKYFKSIFKNIFFYFFILLVVLILSSYFFNTGCLVYPISFTCFENFDWSISIKEVERMNVHYENWSKAGAGPDFQVNNQEYYIQKFSWVGNWIDRYFFNKVSDFLIGLIFLQLIFFLFFYNKNYIKKLENKKIKLFYITILVLFFEWFYNHPALRYGGYSLIALLFFIPTSIYLEKYIPKKNFNLKVYTIISLIFLIFIGRNINRIIYEVDSYKFKPFTNVFHYIDDSHFRIEKNLKKIKENSKNCEMSNKYCERNSNLLMKKIMNRYVIFTNK